MQSTLITGNGKLAPDWKITNLGAGFYDITAFSNVEMISIYQ
jgi:hypothetical protein